MTKLLVVDDEALVRALAREVGSGLGYEVACAATLAEGLALGYKGVDIVLLDVLLPDGNGLERIKDFSFLPGRPEVLIVTGHGDGDLVEAALRSGVWEFLTKPLGVQELSQALAQLGAHRAARPRQHEDPSLARAGLIGSSPHFVAALKLLQEAASSKVNVLLLGETGAGKELFANALHKNSARAARPFVTVDCASLSSTLVESHLFGHSKGAFTGADRSREGLLASAHEGTLFLDEVGDLPVSMQGSFLRALELRRFRPLGDLHEVESHFRLVSATNRNLDQLADLNLFRRDLLFRLRGLAIHIPPLRERADDIPELARHAVLRFCTQHNMPPKEITDGCLKMLLGYTWPGNVRELFHTLARACLAAGEQDCIFAGHLPTELRVAVTRLKVEQPRQDNSSMQELLSGDSLPNLRDWKQHAEAIYLARLLEFHAGDMRKAAATAGLSRGHMYELLKKHDAHKGRNPAKDIDSKSFFG